MKEKTCRVCGITKTIDMFYRGSININKDGYKNECKACKCEDSRRRRIANPEYHREYIKKWYQLNREKVRKNSIEWISNNKERYRECNRQRNIEYRKNIKIKLNNRWSCAIRKSLKTGAKSRIHWELLVGYTASELKIHIEKQFTPEMSWQNHGTYWHIDHKVPVSAFNFTSSDDIDFKRCWSLKNLQPLKATDNISKHDRLDKPFQPSLKIEWKEERG
jgi:hypothetical protein